jgi:saccharopine dehydrogenase-like NADP-dependent oxidoreductase
MSRTTAFPATSVLRQIAAGKVRTPGVHAPEALAGMRGVLDAVLADLRARGVEYRPWMETAAAPRPKRAERTPARTAKRGARRTAR